MEHLLCLLFVFYYVSFFIFGGVPFSSEANETGAGYTTEIFDGSDFAQVKTKGGVMLKPTNRPPSLPTNVGITRATPVATPLLVISDGVEIRAALAQPISLA